MGPNRGVWIKLFIKKYLNGLSLRYFLIRREWDFLSDLGCLALRASDNPSNPTASQAIDSLIKLN